MKRVNINVNKVPFICGLLIAAIGTTLIFTNSLWFCLINILAGFILSVSISINRRG